MKLRRIAAIVLLAASCAYEQAPVTSVIVQLSHSLNTKKVRVGDKVSAKTIQDLIVGGKIVIPNDSKLIGHITDVQAITKADPRSRLAMVFEQVDRKGGGSLPIHAFIQALGPPLPPNPALDSAMASSSYGGSDSRHPGSAGDAGHTNQANSSAPGVASGRRGTAAAVLQQREGALKDAEHTQSGNNGRHGTVLTVRSHGVFGLPGLALAATAPVPVIVAVGQNVQLKNGTQIVLELRTQLP